MSTINAKDSSRPTDNRGLNRYNQNRTDTGGKSDKTGTGRPYVAGSNKNRTMNQTAWSNKEQRDVKLNGVRNNKNTNSVSGGNRDNRGTRPNGNGKPFGYGGGYGFHKDDDYEDGNRKNKYSAGGQRSEVKSKSAPGKEKEPQSDKLETIKRLEKEKKALERRNQELEKEKAKQNKPPMKKKRTGNIDWTKGYAKGLYGDDDEDDYTDYF
ncbi:hypothetical protein [Anaerocolumna xylanovorans]|uniref:Uncharacterized protein n=1 Tax=Anaerocolumna xylanovorans DSM 12503 TaxID=1121345 RepID=A0A1M7Y5J9_9FIRM|nr:hypothetical protein [Anaerocolumna xylanovorans]SHO47826.1 hypothetical protein SAMN02745217_01667 [Anaerocolumna xylanovorans DSM 12503]